MNLDGNDIELAFGFTAIIARRTKAKQEKKLFMHARRSSQPARNRLNCLHKFLHLKAVR
ncbi:MAG TPA: hypothetical protein VF553_07935 [Pyrinomonadaceae bacterium]|jgi:hypothetical protein